MPVASELLVRVSADTKQLESGLRSADSQVSSFAKSAGMLGGVAATVFTGVGIAAVGLGAGLAVAVGSAMDFQQGIADVAALLGGDVAANTATLSDLALQLGQDITLSGVGATDAAAAMRELAAAGFTAGEMADGVTRGVLLLASATGTDVARAAEIAGDTFNTFRKSLGLTAADMPMIADLFTGTANASSVGLEDIGQAMSNLGPIAAAMGIGLEDVTATIAALGNQGIKGGEAGTALRGILASLADPSKESAKLIKDLGLNFRDADGQMKGFGGIAEELQTKLAGLTDAQREQALVQLFGREGLAAATALYGEGAEGIQKYMEAIAAQGNAAAIGAQRNNTFRGALESLKGSVETALIALGRGLLPALQGFAQRMAGAVSAAIPFVTMIGQKLGAALTVAIGLFQRFGSYVSSAITAVVDAFGKLQSGQITLAQFIGGIKNMIATLVGDLFGGGGGDFGVGKFFGAVVGVIRQWFPIVQNELAILGRAFGEWVNTTALPWLMPRLQALLSAIGTWITGTALPAIGAWLVSVGQAFGDWVQTTAIPFLQANVPLWLSALGTWITGTALPAIGGWLGAVASAFGTWITETAIPFLQANLPLWLAAYMAWAETARPVILAWLKETGQAFGTWVTETAIPWLLTNIPAWLAALSGWYFGTAAPAIRAFLIDAGLAFGEWVATKAVPYVLENLPKWQAAVEGWITGTAIPAIIRGLLVVGEKFGDWISNKAVPYVLQKLPEWQAAITNWIVGTAVPAIINAAKELGLSLVEGFYNSMIVRWGLVKAWLSTIPAQVKAAIGDLASALFQKGVDLVQGFLNGIKSKAGEVAAAIAGLAGGIPGVVNKVLDMRSPSKVMMEVGQNIIAGLIEGMDDKQAEAAKKAADVASAVAKAVTDTLGAMKALANFDFASDSPTGDDMGVFAHLTTSLLATMQEAAAGFEAEALKHTSAFADTVGKVGASVKNAVEGLVLLGKTDWATASPDGNAMAWFVHLISSLVENFRQASTGFEEDGLTAATVFAEAVGKVTGVISTAVTGLQALREFVAPAEENVSRFMSSLADLMEKFGTWAGSFEADSLAASSVFAEAAGKVTGSLSNGVTGLAALRDFAAPAEAGVSAFLAALSDLMEKFGTWAGNFEKDALEHTNLFAEVAGKALAAAKTGVDLFKSFDKLGIPSKEAIDNLMIAIDYVVKQFGVMASRMENEGLRQLAAFAEAAGKSLSAVKTGTDLFKQMEKLAVPSEAAIDYLLGTIGLIITKIRQIATGIGTEGLREAQDFSAGALAVINTLAAALKTFEALTAYELIPAKILESLHGKLEGALDWAHQLWERSEAIKAEAAAFANNMKDAARLFAEGMSLGNGMGGTWTTAGATTSTTPAPPVVPMAAMRGGGGGGGVTVVMEYHDHSPTADRSRLADFARQLKPEMDRLVTAGW